MFSYFFEDNLKYTGKELSPHFIYRKTGKMGDAIFSFIGECDVPINHMVDIEDVLDNSPIYSKKMLHFLVEIFNIDLYKGVLLQRLLVVKAIELIKEICPNIDIKRVGDDIFINEKKASVSIASKSLTSILIHFAINIVSEGAIIEVSSFENDTYVSDYKEFAEKLMISYINEIEDIKLATTKVLGVYNE